MATAKLVAKPLYVAAALQLPELLAERPATAAELAARTETNPDALCRLLRTLASVGIFHQDESGRFSNTELAELVRDRPGSLRPLVLWMNDPRHDRLWEELLHCVRTGETAAPRATGRPFWDYLSSQPDLEAAFNACMSANAQAMHAAALDAYQVGADGVVVDVGGCQGALLEKLLGRRPELRGVLFDRPGIASGARLAAAGLLDRCQVVSGDFFQSVPRGDLHLLSHIIHDWDDERALSILRNCHRAGRPGGRVAIIEMLLPPGNEPSFAKLLDLEMLVLAGGRERTAEQYRALLAAAGYGESRVIEGPRVAAVIEGTRS
jgi:SAM-dependent methyltransferase